MGTTHITRPLTLASIALLTTAALGFAAQKAEVPTLRDMSPAGLRAAASVTQTPDLYLDALPEGATEAIRSFVTETRQMGLDRRSSRLFIPGPTNVRANNTAGDRIGETNAEIAVAVNKDTVVIGWNDSQGFLGGGITLTSYAYSTNGGATFTDGGNVPLALPTDQAFGDAGWDTDEMGNWYLNQIYTRTAGNPGPTAQQNIGVHHARFNGAGVLVLDPPTMASIGTSATGLLDKCLLGCDRVTGNVYVAYTRFTATPQIEIVRSTTTGATWGAPIILDNTALPTASKQAARPFCGPNGEVYVVWEKGANTINCPDGSGNVTNPLGQIAFTRSLDFGGTYAPFTVIGNVDLTFMASGPGDLRERGNEFPDIAVDMSNGCYRGNIYVTWHEAGAWTSNLSAGPVKAEAADAANANPTSPELFNVGDNCTGSSSSTSDLDYWQFNAVQGQSYLMNLDPQGFNCGVTGTTRGMRMRLFAVTNPFPNPTGFPDSLLAASAQGAFAQRIVWTCPSTGPYLLRLQPSTTAIGTYTLRVRTLTFTAATPARDARDITMVVSNNQGTTWSAEKRINDDPAGLENRRPFVAVNDAGAVTAYWHDSRDAGFGSSASLTSVYGTISRDGGATWSPNFTVTDEPSFFSFNTLGVPNLGDYNQAAAGRTTSRFHAAWSDQRISSGDVRTPGTNTYTAGTGPDAYTTGISFKHGVVCPSPVIGSPGASVMVTFRIQNQGNVPDQYNYTVTDNAGWIGGPINGATGAMLAGGFFDVMVKVDVSPLCTPASDQITFSAIPVGEACANPITCTATVNCDQATATLIQRFEAVASARGVELDWTSDAVGMVREWNVYRSLTETSGFERINEVPIAMGSGGAFHFRDVAAPGGTLFYRLAGVLADGTELVMDTRSLDMSGDQPFAIVGSNPFSSRTSFRYSLAAPTHVRIDVYSVTGQKVRSLANGVQEAGAHTVALDRSDARGNRLGAGIYMVRYTAGAETRSVRVIAFE